MHACKVWEVKSTQAGEDRPGKELSLRSFPIFEYSDKTDHRKRASCSPCLANFKAFTVRVRERERVCVCV